ncbi:MAG: TRIC cation channel family protein [Lachnospiraceae bacterium]
MDIQDYIVFCMELVGTVAFAASGAVVGINCRMDVFGVCVLGVVTAVGGGMTRDVILGKIPGALVEPVYVAVAVAAALLVFLVEYFKKGLLQGKTGVLYERIMLVMDSVGLGIFTGMGVMTGIRNGYLENTFLLVFLGTLTGVGGGLLRDMMAGVPPYIFVKHIYACASVVGAMCCVWLYRDLGQIPAMMISAVLIILIRFLAAYYHWNLPRMKREEET